MTKYVVQDGSVYARRLPTIALAIGTLILGARFFLFIHRYAVNVFFGDQWDFLSAFFDHQAGLAELFFWQHGPHREGIGLIADKYLYAWTNWNARIDSFVIGGSIFAAMGFTLVLSRKLFGPFVLFDLSIPAIFLTLAQYETLVGTTNLAYSAFPLLMIVFYCLALLHSNVHIKYGIVLGLNFLLIYTGFGLFMGIVTIGLFALEYHWSIRRMTTVPPIICLAALIIAIASFGSFFIHYAWAPAVDCFEPPRHRLWAYPWFMSLMFARFLGFRTGIAVPTAVGLLLLLAALMILLSDLRHLVTQGSTPTHLLSGILLSYSILFSANTAIGRLCLGLPEAAQSSRYLTLMIPAFLAMYFHLRSSKYHNFVLLLAGSMLMLAAVPKTDATAHWLIDGKRAWADCYKRIGDIYICDRAAHFAIYPRPEANDLQRKLDFLKERHLNLFVDQLGN